VISMLGVVIMRWNSNTMTRLRIDLSKLLLIQIYLLCLLKILRQSQLFYKMMWLSKQGHTLIAIGVSPVVHQVGQEAGGGATGARGGPRAVPSREVGVGAVGTRDSPGTAHSREAGAVALTLCLYTGVPGPQGTDKHLCLRLAISNDL
jgi:hypothetical protein